MAIVKGITNMPKKVVIYGPEGIGKSTFASKFPSPVFIDTEGSTKYMDVARFEKTESWDDILLQINEAMAVGSYKTIIVDTVDWADLMCIKAVCSRLNVTGIEDIGYGKGYVYVSEEFKKLLDKLEDCVNRGFNVVMTAHAQMRKFEQPEEMGAYDRWEMKLSKKAAPMVKEWSDMLLFANYKTMVVEESKTKVKKATGGQRVMYATHHPCWDAKNRFGLPDQMDFSYDAIRHIIEGSPKNVAEPVKKEEPKKEERKLTPQEEAFRPKEGEPEEIDFKPATAYDDLKQLMEKARITDAEVHAAVASKDLQPGDMAVKDYPEEFIREFLIAKFEGFSKYIEKNFRDLPFIEHYEKEPKKAKKEDKK